MMYGKREKDNSHVTSMKNLSMRNFVVSDLIEQDRKEWRKSFIEENFNYRYASNISKTLL